MEEWEAKLGLELGTGYGNDPVTQNFLWKSLESGSFNLPVTRVLNVQAQKVSREFWKQGGRLPLPGAITLTVPSLLL